MTNQIISGSLRSIAQQNNQSIAETFLSCDVVIVVDTSGSMGANDSRGGKSRYSVACEELAALQKSLPGKIAVIAFSDDVQFCPSGIPEFFQDGTNLTKALKFVKVADVPDMRFILISDGEPHDEQSALEEAKKFKNRIDVIYVGPEERPSGRQFLERLSKATGGVSVTADKAQELAASVTRLLATGR